MSNTQLPTDEIALPCNTKKVKEARKRAWFSTVYNYTISDNKCDIVSKLHTYKCKIMAQEEICPTTGKSHIQMTFKFPNGKTFNQVKELIGNNHIEPCQNWKASVNYCRKQETRSGCYSFQNIWNDKLKDNVKDKVLNDTQKWINEKYLTEPDDRKVFWVYDSVGNQGKTSFCKHLCMKYNNCLILGGKSADAKFAISAWYDEPDNQPIKAVFFNIPRGKTFQNYEILETIKDGIFFSSKFKSNMVIFDSPHIFVLANHFPKIETLTKDRWVIYDVEQKREVGAELAPIAIAEDIDFCFEDSDNE